MIHDLFNFCVKILEWIGDITGMGYEMANIVIFIFIQPALILLSFVLWLKARKKR